MNRADITPALVTQLIAGQFPQWADLPIRPVEVNGWDNTTFHLGEEMSVRLPSGDAYAAQVDKEQRWLPILARELPLPIPEPVAKGAPGFGYPRPWSVYRWIEGETASVAHISDRAQFATGLAEFLTALHGVRAQNGPPAGKHNFFRGGDLEVFDGETRQALEDLDDRVDTAACTAVWEAARSSIWDGEPVWVHGDFQAGNLLVSGGNLSAVIDFGCAAVGDPACDLAIAWTFLEGESREAFRSAVAMDESTWARARGWALWKALIMLAQFTDGQPRQQAMHRRVIDNVLAEHQRLG